MTKYICKCGRVVAKSTNADNTGNRNTSGCEGCPYLLPWGPMVWDDQQKGYTQDVKGYECRMSPTIEYTTTYHGRADDKCSLRIVSLDLDFLDEVQAWIYDNAAYTLRAGFSRGSMRATDFCNRGRYSLSVTCAQNKAGMAAKAALLARFFGPRGHRLDMTPQQEKAHILATIEAGKARAQKGEDKKVEYIISRNTENGLTYAYYRGAFWFWDERAGRWFLSPHAKELYADFSAGQPSSKPEDMLCSGNFEALDDWDIPAKVIDDLLSRNPKKEKQNPTSAAEDAQPCAPTASDVPPSQSQSVDADAQQGEGDDAANPTDAAPASPADAGAATQSLSAAEPASLAAESAQPAFDYSGLDPKTVDTLHVAEQMIFKARRDAHIQIAQAVSFAHDALCGGVVQNLDNSKHGNRGDESFGCWCKSVGISRSAAYSYLNVASMFFNSTPEEQAALLNTGKSLLAEAAKPSAPAELVQAVKDGDITTHKQYQEAMAQLKAEREAREESDRRHQAELESNSAMLAEEQRRRQEANEARIAAEKDALRYKEMKDAALETVKQQREKTHAAERRASAAEAEVARQKRIGMEMQEEVESRDERIRELEQSQTVVAGTADPEEIERRAQEIAQSQIAENDAKWTEITENQGRQLRELRAAAGAAQAVRIAIRSVQSILESLFQTMLPEKDDIAGQAALEELDDLLSEYSNYIHDMFRTEENREEAEV